jgi:hypothetical protein
LDVSDGFVSKVLGIELDDLFDKSLLNHEFNNVGPLKLLGGQGVANSLEGHFDLIGRILQSFDAIELFLVQTLNCVLSLFQSRSCLVQVGLNNGSSLSDF